MVVKCVRAVFFCFCRAERRKGGECGESGSEFRDNISSGVNLPEYISSGYLVSSFRSLRSL